MQIDLSKRFRDVLRELPKVRRREIANVIEAVQAGFGAPHLHSGLGIRRLRDRYFECRVGLSMRLVFRVAGGVLHFLTAGNHDHVRRFIKKL